MSKPVIASAIEVPDITTLKEARLSANSKRVLISFIIFGISMPITSLFTGTFLWRETNDIGLIAIYGISQYITTFIVFVLNSFLLKHVNIKLLFSAGMILFGIANFLLMFNERFSVAIVVLFSIAIGASAGLMWANRNLIHLNATNKSNRDYFNGLLSVCDTLSLILVPLLAGILIVYTQSLNFADYKSAYILLGAFVFLVMFLSSIFILGAELTNPTTKFVFIRKASRIWWYTRLLTFFGSMMYSILYLISGVIVLLYAGDEDTLGLLQSVSAFFGAMALYLIVRKISKKDRTKMLLLRALFVCIGAIIFLLDFGFFGVAAVFLVIAISQPFWTTAIFGIWHESIEDEAAETGINTYNYFIDLEFWINLGRISSLVIILIVVQSAPTAAAIISAVLAIIFSQVMLALVTFLLQKAEASSTSSR